MVRKKTHEEFVKDLNKVHGERVYIPLEKYINARTKILVKHSKCGYEWEIKPNSLLSGKGCPKCNGGIKKTHDEFVKDVKDKYGNEYTVLEQYVNDCTKILVRHNCKECNFHEWEITPSNLLQGRICPVCLGRVAKLGINTIWDTDRWMVNLGVSKEDAKKYSHGSGQRIMVKCPDCGKEKKIVISTLYIYKSIGCSCSDGKSYPEKFVVNLLEQLNIDFETEYSPKWIKPKRYDFYISDLNMIIETHGKQHYSSKASFKSIGGRTFKEEQLNDKYKREMALKKWD